jgi:hypothetical protein
MPRKTYTTDMTDAEWELIEPLLPAERRRGAPRQASSRERDFLHYKNSCTWRDLPGGLSYHKFSFTRLSMPASAGGVPMERSRVFNRRSTTVGDSAKGIGPIPAPGSPIASQPGRPRRAESVGSMAESS